MSNKGNMNFQLIDNTGAVEKALDENVDRVLEMIGLQAAGYAALNLEDNPRRIDTGLLRNSITYALAGQAPAKQTYSADTGDGSGRYQGKMAKSEGEHSVYVGTNVEYAPYVEYGAKLPSGATMEANHFIKNAITEHMDEYKDMLERGLKGEL